MCPHSLKEKISLIQDFHQCFFFSLKLLKRNAASRLGAGPGDAGEVQVGIEMFGVWGNNANLAYL